MTPKNLRFDFDQANRFLTALDGGREGGRFTFQTFDDDNARKDPKLARTLHGRLSDRASQIEALNQRGAGIFVTVNEVQDGARRTIPNIIRVRALFVDLDGAPIQPVLEWRHAPHIVVESSRNKFHAYWRTDGSVPLDKFTPLQTKLAVLFKGDERVKDLARVLRLPGSWHQKVRDGVRSEPFKTVIREDLNASR
jgi:hypothetical protein